MDLTDYFVPVKRDTIDYSILRDSMYSYVHKNDTENGFPDLTDVKIAFFGVNEDRACVNNQGCGKAPDFIRDKFYALKKGNFDIKIIDLGNINGGFDVKDTYFALSAVCSELMKKGIIPVVLGGSQDLTFAQYKAYETLEQTINIVGVDARFDLGVTEEPLDSQSYLGKIVEYQPNYLFNYSNIGYQSYFVGAEAVELMDKLYFDAYRLGQIRANIEDAEPIVRNADLVTFDISSIRFSDAPGNKNASPHGFYGEEACQIARYAGLSDKVTSLGLYEVNPSADINNQTSHLVAQLFWYFIDGVSSRKKDFPITSKAGFTKYRVNIKNTDHEIVFYKSERSSRWWMEVPYMTNKIKYERHHIIPCSYQDYQTACNEEMPERWWQAFQKLS